MALSTTRRLVPRWLLPLLTLGMVAQGYAQNTTVDCGNSTSPANNGKGYTITTQEDADVLSQCPVYFGDVWIGGGPEDAGTNLTLRGVQNVTGSFSLSGGDGYRNDPSWNRNTFAAPDLTYIGDALSLQGPFADVVALDVLTTVGWIDISSAPTTQIQASQLSAWAHPDLFGHPVPSGLILYGTITILETNLTDLQFVSAMTSAYSVQISNNVNLESISLGLKQLATAYESHNGQIEISGNGATSLNIALDAFENVSTSTNIANFLSLSLPRLSTVNADILLDAHSSVASLSFNSLEEITDSGSFAVRDTNLTAINFPTLRSAYAISFQDAFNGSVADALYMPKLQYVKYLYITTTSGGDPKGCGGLKGWYCNGTVDWIQCGSDYWDEDTSCSYKPNLNVIIPCVVSSAFVVFVLLVIWYQRKQDKKAKHLLGRSASISGSTRSWKSRSLPRWLLPWITLGAVTKGHAQSSVCGNATDPTYFVLYSQDAADLLSQCSTVYGSVYVHISEPAPGNVTLSNVRNVTGVFNVGYDITMTSNYTFSMETFAAPDLEFVGDQFGITGPVANVVALDSLKQVGSVTVELTNSTIQVQIPNPLSWSCNYPKEDSSCGTIYLESMNSTDISFLSGLTDAYELTLRDNNIESFSLPLRTLGSPDTWEDSSPIYMLGNSVDQKFDIVLDELETLWGLVTINGFSSLSMEKLKSFNSTTVLTPGPSWLDLRFTAMETFELVQLNNAKITGLSFPSLQSADSLSLNGSSFNGSVADSIHMPKLQNMNALDVNSGYSDTGIEGCSALQVWYCTGTIEAVECGTQSINNWEGSCPKVDLTVILPSVLCSVFAASVLLYLWYRYRKNKKSKESSDDTAPSNGSVKKTKSRVPRWLLSLGLLAKAHAQIACSNNEAAPIYTVYSQESADAVSHCSTFYGTIGVVNNSTTGNITLHGIRNITGSFELYNYWWTDNPITMDTFSAPDLEYVGYDFTITQVPANIAIFDKLNSVGSITIEDTNAMKIQIPSRLSSWSCSFPMEEYETCGTIVVLRTNLTELSFLSGITTASAINIADNIYLESLSLDLKSIGPQRWGDFANWPLYVSGNGGDSKLEIALDNLESVLGPIEIDNFRSLSLGNVTTFWNDTTLSPGNGWVSISFPALENISLERDPEYGFEYASLEINNANLTSLDLPKLLTGSTIQITDSTFNGSVPDAIHMPQLQGLETLDVTADDINYEDCGGLRGWYCNGTIESVTCGSDWWDEYHGSCSDPPNLTVILPSVLCSVFAATVLFYLGYRYYRKHKNAKLPTASPASRPGTVRNGVNRSEDIEEDHELPAYTNEPPPPKYCDSDGEGAPLQSTISAERTAHPTYSSEHLTTADVSQV